MGAMDDDDDKHQAYGVFKPVGHVLLSFPGEAEARDAVEAMRGAGFAAADVTLFPAADVALRSRRDIAEASPLAALGQELNLVKAHLALAEAGHPFVAVKVEDDDAALRIAGIGQRFGADRAQHYGRFVIEELIEPGTGEGQVAESPDRGLDAQTPSGDERSRLRPD